MAVKNDISLQTFVVAKENGFACSGRRGSDLPRLILFFVAAKENGFACSGRSGNDVRVRFYSPRTAPPAQQGRAPRHDARKPLGLLPGRFYQKTILFMNGVWWAYGMKAREGSGSVIIREARFPGVIEPRVSSTPMA